MKLLGKLTLFLGGLLTMTTLQACGPADPSVSNRTVEQHNLEKEFQPLFDFLAQEKKDFSDVKSYKSSLSKRTLGSSEKEYYSIEVERGNEFLTGFYNVRDRGTEDRYQVDMASNGSLTYHDSIVNPYKDRWQELVLERVFFEKQKLYESDSHPNTYLKSLGYRVDKKRQSFSRLLEEFSLSDKAKTTIGLTKSYGEQSLIYDIKIIFEDNDGSIVSMYLAVSFDKEDSND